MCVWTLERGKRWRVEYSHAEDENYKKKINEYNVLIFDLERVMNTKTIHSPIRYRIWDIEPSITKIPRHTSVIFTLTEGCALALSLSSQHRTASLYTNTPSLHKCTYSVLCRNHQCWQLNANMITSEAQHVSVHSHIPMQWVCMCDRAHVSAAALSFIKTSASHSIWRSSFQMERLGVNFCKWALAVAVAQRPTPINAVCSCFGLFFLYRA